VEDALDFLTQKGNFEDTAQAPRPGIIFLDINMPGLTGWDFMDRYKDIDSALRAKVIVVMLTTSLNPDDRERALLDGQIVDFFPKPLRAHMLDELVEKYFEPH
jgi:CheY-like chemotaxis protein